jgi:ABC-type antimicrobial peptide transport system permease subunit
VPITQNPWFDATVAIRGTGSAENLASGLRAAIARVDKDLALTRVRTMEEIAAGAVARPRFRAQLLAGFAAVALLLSAVGVFGVLAFSVSRRRREFGIRMALGAQTRGVLSLVIWRAAKITGAGVALGLVGAALLARGLGTLLFGVRPDDPGTLAFAGGCLAWLRWWLPRSQPGALRQWIPLAYCARNEHSRPADLVTARSTMYPRPARRMALRLGASRIG